MPRPKRRIKSFYDDTEFYTDPLILLVNMRLYQDRGIVKTTQQITQRAFSLIYPKDIEVIFGFSATDSLLFLFYIRERMKMAHKGSVGIADLFYILQMDTDVIVEFIRQS